MSVSFEVTPQGLFVLKGVHASYPHLSKAHSFDNDPEKARFSINALIPVSEKAYGEMKKALASKMPKDGPKADPSKLPFKEISGDKLPQAWIDREGVSAHSVKFTSKTAPQVYDEKGMPASPEIIQGGDVVNVAFSAFGFSNKFGSFLQLQVAAVQKVASDLSFGGAAPQVDASVFGIAPVDFAKPAPAGIDPFDDQEIPF